MPAPTTRRKTKAAPARRRAVKKPIAKQLAKLDEYDLLQVNRLCGLMELKQVEIAALQGHFNQMTKDIKYKYGVEGNITIDFQTGAITEAVDRNE